MGKTWRRERSDFDDHRSKKGFVKRQRNVWREAEIEEENEYESLDRVYEDSGEEPQNYK